MNIAKIKQSTNFLGREIIYQEEMESTQELAKQLAKKNLKQGSLILTDYQTKGKGTKGRSWFANKGKNIMMTIFLQPHCPIIALEGFTVKIAQEIQKSIRDLYGYNLTIKEPNDVFLNGKKIGGILTECSSLQNIVKELYIGIGFNVNEEEFEKELCSVATSLKKEFQKEFEREEILIAFLKRIENLVKSTLY